MQVFLEYLTTALVYMSILAIIMPIFIFTIDEDSLKPNAPSMLLWSINGGIILFFITTGLIATGVLPDIFN